MKNLPLIEFNPKLPKLSKNQKDVLRLLVEAGKFIAPLYLEQEKHISKKIDRKKIEKAAKKDPSILSPYTIIEEINGKIVATPYHIKYKTFLEPIVDKLNEAGKLTENKEFGRALKIQAKALLDGNYTEVIVSWLKIKKPYIIDIAIGPLPHFESKLPFNKTSYQAWIGLLDKEGTDKLNNYKTITLSARRKAMQPKDRIDNLDKVKAKVLDVVLFSGLIAKTKFVGINLPVDTSLVKEYGSEVRLFNQPNDLRLKEQILPSFNKIFSPGFRQGFDNEDLRRGYLRAVALHELAHSYLYYKNSAKNLQDLFPIIYELAATILGLRLAGALLLKDRITEKQLQSMIVAFTSRSYYLLELSKTTDFMRTYTLGGILFINFIKESGALKQTNGIIFPNFTKIFVSLHDLSNLLESLLAQGTRKDAESFIKKYSS